MNSAAIILGQIALLVVLGFVLIKSTKLAASAIEALVNHSKQRKFGLVVFIVALSVSLPELVMAVVASINGAGELALANVIGSNIANISLVLGGAALISGSVWASDKMIKNEIVSVFLIGCLPLLLLMDKQLSRIEGLALVILYGVYMVKELGRSKKTEMSSPKAEEQIKNLLHKLTNHTLEKRIGLFGLGIMGMLASAQAIVMVATSLANYAVIPAFLVGLFILAVGTSLPELAFEVVAIKHRQSTMAFGNIIGSIVANGTIIIGLAAMIKPIVIETSMRAFLISNLGFVVIFGLFWWFTKTKHRLDRREGLSLVVAYLVFGLIQYFLR